MKQNSGELLKSEIFSDFKPISEDLQRIKNVAVIGVGVMGRGIVQAIAQAGFDVIAVEKNEVSLNISKEKLEEALDYEIQRWAMTKIDDEKNDSPEKEKIITTDDSKVKVLVIPTNQDEDQGLFHQFLLRRIAITYSIAILWSSISPLILTVSPSSLTWVKIASSIPILST